MGDSPTDSLFAAEEGSGMGTSTGSDGAFGTVAIRVRGWAAGVTGGEVTVAVAVADQRREGTPLFLSFSGKRRSHTLGVRVCDYLIKNSKKHLVI